MSFLFKNRAFLLIEVIFALSLFAIFAGAITQGFMTGLNVRSQSGVSVNPNDIVKINLLIDNITLKHIQEKEKIELSFPVLDENSQNKIEKWELNIKNSKEIKTIGSTDEVKNSENEYELSVGNNKENWYGVIYSLDIQIKNDREENNRFNYSIFKFLPKKH